MAYIRTRRNAMCLYEGHPGLERIRALVATVQLAHLSTNCDSDSDSTTRSSRCSTPDSDDLPFRAFTSSSPEIIQQHTSVVA
ncbi:hypothetical protein RI367_006993 [Sorochytrium milnesiophthora]